MELGEKLDKVGKGLDLVQKDTQSVNAKVEALSRERKDRLKLVSMHESERSFEEGNYSEGGRRGRHERLERVKRNGREERREKHGRRGVEPRRKEIDMAKVVVRFVTVEFGDYALVWWIKMLEDIRRGVMDPCED
ncbi:hypothetical protein CR513_11570, partial [Mucuna pruriens]